MWYNASSKLFTFMSFAKAHYKGCLQFTYFTYSGFALVEFRELQQTLTGTRSTTVGTMTTLFFPLK